MSAEKRKVTRFEDLIAWQKARTLSMRIYEITNQGAFSRDYGLKDQIRRAAISVMSNLAEGFERGSKAEFRHFVNIAKGSCAEVRSQLYSAFDVGYIDEEQHKYLHEVASEVSKVVGGLLSSLKRKL